MLVNLHIENVAVIEKADIAFGAGLHVLTGETGAGKSIVIDALNAVLGERVSRDLVRTDSKEAIITAEFDHLSPAVLSFLTENHFTVEDDETLFIMRTISAEGKGSARINGRPVNVSVLRQLGRMLVNIHGQHENQKLLAVDSHIDYLDKLGHYDSIKEEYYTAYRRYCKIYKELSACNQDETQKTRQAERLRFEIEEIDGYTLQEDEETVLQQQREFFRNSEKIARNVMQAHLLLNGDGNSDGISTSLDKASRELTQVGEYNEKLYALSLKLQELTMDIQEVTDDVRRFFDALEFDAAERDRVEERLEVIHRLSSKYGSGTRAILMYADNARAELSAIIHADEYRAQLEQQRDEAEQYLVECARALTAARRATAAQFSERVIEELRFLDMPSVQFAVSIEEDTLTSTGGDRVEFMLSANAGEPLKSLARVASGGELSRIMLAIQSVMADVDGISTLVFDEIDTGISGRAAQKVGLKLLQASCQGKRQILCVTHLAQIACYAGHHLLIRKAVRDNRTYTDVVTLDLEGRECELARIIGGDVNDSNRIAARAMLSQSERGMYE